MKKLSFIFLFIITGALLSCSNDDGESKRTDGELVGTWKATSINTSGNAQTDVNGTPFNIPIAADVTNNNLTLVFNNDNTFTSSGSMDVDASISIVGTTYDQSLNAFNPIGSGTYTVSGNQILFTGNTDLGAVMIDELTDTLLILQLKNVVDTTQDGQDITATLNSTVKFARQ
ncbi:Lipocalin-like domain-containing protein [Flavobacteriaceae bacterium MAR_2010_188]|nr:Lipocalin-like domain-containing protein [Flavobacteriaceae bacterium MAR_2010_188]